VVESNEGAPADLTSTVVRGISLAAAGYIVAQVLNLGFYIALARLLSPQDFGEFAAATVVIGLTSLIAESGLAAAVIQRRDRIDEAASTAAAATVVAGIGFSLLAIATAPLVGDFFDSEQVAALAVASAGMILVRTSGAIPDALLQRRFSFLRRLVIEPAQVLAFGTAAVVAAALDLGAWALVIGQYSGFIIAAALSWILVRWRPQRELISFSMWRELAGYGRHIFVAGMILQAGDQVSTGLVGRLLGTSALGQFRYALRLASTPFALLLAGAAYVLFPAFSRIADDRKRLEGAFLRSLRWVAALSFPAGLVFIPLGIPIAVIVFGEVWRDAGEALMAMSLLCGGAMIANVVSEALKPIAPQMLTRMHLVTSIVTVGAIVALYPLGLTAASAGLSLGAVAGGTYAVYLMRSAKGTSIRVMWAEIWPPAAAALGAAVALVPVEALIDAESHGTSLGLVLLLVEMLIGALAYLALIRLFAPRIAATLADGARAVVRRIARFRGPDPPVPEPEVLNENLAP